MFEYASGIINIWEKNIFGKVGQERMLNAPDWQKAFEVLCNTDIGDVMEEKEAPEEVLQRDVCRLEERIWDMVGKEKPEMFYSLFLKFDAFNLKYALKKYFGKDEVRNVKPFNFSWISLEEMRKIVEEDSSTAGNEFSRKMAKDTKQILKNVSDVDSRKIEQVVDKCFLEIKLQVSKKVDRLATYITKLEIDIANIKKVLGKEEQEFIKGGNFTKKDIEKIFLSEEEKFSEEVTTFLEIYRLSLSYKRHQSGRFLEKGLENYLSSEIFRQEKSGGVGVAKVLGFFQRKLNSYSNIRTILFGKKSGMSSEEIQKNLLPV